MNENRWLISLIVLIAAADVFVGGYLWWSGRYSNQIATISGAGTGDNKQNISAYPSQISPDRANSPFVTQSGTVRFWNNGDRSIAESHTSGGQYQTLAILPQPSAQSLIWAPGGQYFAAETNNNGARGWQVFSLRAQTWQTLPEHTITAAFSPRSDQIVYLQNDGVRGNISLMLTGSSGVRDIIVTRISDAVLAWPSDNTIAMIVPDQNGAFRSLYFLSIEGQLRRIIDARSYLEMNWSPDGSRAILSWFDENDTLNTGIMAAESGREVPLPIATTAGKCAWRGVSDIVCAVPKSPLSPMGYGRAVVMDDLALIHEVGSGTWESQLISASRSLSISGISGKGSVVVFGNAIDGTLWTLNNLR